MCYSVDCIKNNLAQQINVKYKEGDIQFGPANCKCSRPYLPKDCFLLSSHFGLVASLSSAYLLYLNTVKH